jgi:hypothetical protein
MALNIQCKRAASGSSGGGGRGGGGGERGRGGSSSSSGNGSSSEVVLDLQPCHLQLFELLGLDSRLMLAGAASTYMQDRYTLVSLEVQLLVQHAAAILQQQQQQQQYKLRLLLQQVMLHWADNIPQHHLHYAAGCHRAAAQLNNGFYFAGGHVQQQQQQQLPNHASSDPWLQAHPPAEWVTDVLPLILRLCDSLMDKLEARSAAAAAGALPATSSSSSSSSRDASSEVQALTLFIISLNEIMLACVVDSAAVDRHAAGAAEGTAAIAAENSAAEAAVTSGGGCYCLHAVLEQLLPVLQCLERVVRCMALPAVSLCGHADWQSCMLLTLTRVLQLCGEDGQLVRPPCLPHLAAARTQPQQQQQLYSLVVSLWKACQANKEAYPAALWYMYITNAAHASLHAAFVAARPGQAGSPPLAGCSQRRRQHGGRRQFRRWQHRQGAQLAAHGRCCAASSTG